MVRDRRQQGCVDGRIALHDNAIGGDLLTSADDELVADGQGFLSPEWASAIAGDLERVAPALTPRELSAVRLYAAGMKLTSVARRLGVGPETARTYLNRAREKYASVGRPAPTKTDLYRVAVEDGLLDPPSSPPNRR